MPLPGGAWWTRLRGVAQPGRALRSGRRSRRFKSSHPDHCHPARSFVGHAPCDCPMRLPRSARRSGPRGAAPWPCRAVSRLATRSPGVPATRGGSPAMPAKRSGQSNPLKHIEAKDIRRNYGAARRDGIRHAMRSPTLKIHCSWLDLSQSDSRITQMRGTSARVPRFSPDSLFSTVRIVSPRTCAL